MCKMTQEGDEMELLIIRDESQIREVRLKDLLTLRCKKGWVLSPTHGFHFSSSPVFLKLSSSSLKALYP